MRKEKHYSNRTRDGKFCRKYWNKRDEYGRFTTYIS